MNEAPPEQLKRELQAPRLVEFPSSAPGRALVPQNTALTAPTTAALQSQGRRTRNGKIARLPKDLREMVNRPPAQQYPLCQDR